MCGLIPSDRSPDAPDHWRGYVIAVVILAIILVGEALTFVCYGEPFRNCLLQEFFSVIKRGTDMAEIKINSRTPNEMSRSALIYLLLLAVLVALGLHVLLIAGPAMRVADKQQLEGAIADEDHGFCEMFGMGAGTTKFVACSQELAIIRQKQADRDNAAALGIL